MGAASDREPQRGLSGAERTGAALCPSALRAAPPLAVVIMVDGNDLCAGQGAMAHDVARRLIHYI
jgi:hypothetical protein